MVAGSMTDTVDLRHDWTLEEIQALLDLPLMDLLWRAQSVHRAANPGYRVQLASLLSVRDASIVIEPPGCNRCRVEDEDEDEDDDLVSSPLSLFDDDDDKCFVSGAA